MSTMSDALYAEMITDTARAWKAVSIARAYEASGVEVPVSGDKLAALKAGPARQLQLYRDRDRPMSERLRSLDRTRDQLWDEVA